MYVKEFSGFLYNLLYIVVNEPIAETSVHLLHLGMPFFVQGLRGGASSWNLLSVVALDFLECRSD